MAGPWEQYAQPKGPWMAYGGSDTVSDPISSEPTFMDRISQDFDNRKQQVRAINNRFNAMDTPDQNLNILKNVAASALIGGKAVLGFGSDVTNEAITSVLSGTESPQWLSNTGSSILDNTPVPQGFDKAVNNAIVGYDNFSKANPNASDTIDAVANLANLGSNIEGGVLLGKAVAPAIKAAPQVAKAIAAEGLSKVPALDYKLGKTIRPTAEQLKEVSKGNYAKAVQAGGTLSKDFNDEFIDFTQSFGPRDKMAAVTQGESPVLNFTKNYDEFRGQPMDLERATALDQALTDKLDESAFTDKNGVLNNYGRQVLEIKNGLREKLLNAADAGKVEGGREGIDAYRTAVKDYAAQSQINEVQRIVDKASYMDNPATALKTGFRNIAVNPGRLSKFSPDVQKAIKQAARDGDIANLMRTQIGSRLISSTIGGITGAAAGPLGTIGGALAGAATGGFARNAAESMQMNRVNKVVDAIASDSSIPTRKIPLSEIMKMKPAEARKILQKAKK